MLPSSGQTQLMDQARARVSFNPTELSWIIHGGKDVVERRDAAFDRVETLLGTKDQSLLPICYGNINREEAFMQGLEAGRVTLEDGIDHKHDFFDNNTERYTLSNSSPFGVHTAMFIPTLKLQCSPEQRAHWLPLAESGKIIGAYCQTELGHGTFVRGIETTARFDRKTDEFILHSPTLSSTKFWPGAIGFSCSHAIVMARLVIDKDYGVHPFMVQLRSLEDYTPMPGVELGDIGLKMSYNGTCNGFATFNQVRIPRTNLLMGNAAVSRDGTYTKAPHDKLSYATLLFVRTLIVRNCASQLAQAMTIATRYSTVREQGLGPNGGAPREVAIISYKSQHFRLLSAISKAYAILFAWKSCDTSYRDLIKEQRQGNHSSLPYNHTLVAGLKAWATQTAADSAEDCRKLCGGQGYVSTSGLPEIVAAVTATATFEGENYVLWQQVARYLIKGVSLIRSGKPVSPDLAHIASAAAKDSHCHARATAFTRPETLIDIFRHRAARMALEAADLLASAEKTLPPSDAWNTHMMTLISAARAHTDLFVISSFHANVSSLPITVDPAIRGVLRRLVALFGLMAIANPAATDAVTFLEDGYVNGAQMRDIRGQINVLLEELLPDVVALTDAWNFTDASLCSAIGAYDGNAYERLMSWTRQLPINVDTNMTQGVFVEGFKSSIEPILRRSGSEVEVKRKLDLTDRMPRARL
ncbi:hypothetical protein MMC13_006199 [Lambiella insularis]|nr:hypothetical protein [Lambiella insularis]